MKKWMGMVLVGSLFVLGACGKGEEKPLESAAEKKTVIVGLDDTFVPMGFRDESGELTGFDVELAQALFALDGTKVTFQPIDWSLKETELANQTIDMIWNGYSVTPEREEKVLFTDGYMKSSQVLVTKKTSDITTIAQMKDKKLGVQEGSSGYKALTDQPEELLDQVKDQDPVLYASFNEAFIDLEQGRIDGLLVDSVYAEYFLTQKNQLAAFNLVETPFAQEAFAVGVRKADQKIADKINQGLKTLRENGEFEKISIKWFGQDVTPE